MSRPVRSIVSLGIACIVGGSVGFLLGKADITVGSNGDERGNYQGDATPEFLPVGSAPPFLDQLEDLNFACAPSENYLRECSRALPDESGTYIARLSGPDSSRIAAVAMSLALGNGTASDLAQGWLHAATALRYDGGDPIQAFDWATDTFRRRGGTGSVVAGPAVLSMYTDEAGQAAFEVRARGSRVMRPAVLDDESLAERFAPVLRFSDDFRPISIEQFVDEASLSRFYVSGKYSPRAHVEVIRAQASDGPLPNEPLSDCKGRPFCYYALDLRIAEPRSGASSYASLQKKLAGKPATVYWSVTNGSSGVLIQYWFLYLFNGHSINRHEGDWEQVTVHLKGDTVPIEVGYSSHHSGERMEWFDLVDGLNRSGDRPIVYIAFGSHANYFGPGSKLGRACHWGVCKKGIDTVPIRVDELDPQDYQLQPLTGDEFAGNFGSGNFLWNGKWGWELHKLAVDDPRRREVFLEPLSFLQGSREAP